MKILPPTLRKDHRYLAFEVICQQRIDRLDLLREIFSCSNSLIGDVGSSECEITLLSFEDQCGIIRCRRDRVTTTRAVLATVNHIKGENVLIYVKGVSGTVHGATSGYIENGGA